MTGKWKQIGTDIRRKSRKQNTEFIVDPGTAVGPE